ncbi:MAG: PleD family two-component system response regulator [Anaerolineales bacterium]
MAEHLRQRPKKIVCIEDDRDFLDLLLLMLEGENTDVIAAFGGAEGFETIRRERPDLILLDLMMPDMHGWEVYMKMKADDELRNIPVIVVTALGTRYDKTFGLNVAKVNDYITKPFLPSHLRQSVDAALWQ